MEKYYFVLMNGDNEEYNWFTTLFGNELSEEEIKSEYIIINNIKNKIIPISKIVPFIMKHPNYVFCKENLAIIKEEEIKNKIINDLNL